MKKPENPLRFLEAHKNLHLEATNFIFFWDMAIYNIIYNFGTCRFNVTIYNPYFQCLPLFKISKYMDLALNTLKNSDFAPFKVYIICWIMVGSYTLNGYSLKILRKLIFEGPKEKCLCWMNKFKQMNLNFISWENQFSEYCQTCTILNQPSNCKSIMQHIIHELFRCKYITWTAKLVFTAKTVNF